MILSPCQQKASESFEAFLTNTDKEFILSGFSGVGKTFITQEFLKLLVKRNTFITEMLGQNPMQLVLTATTNKAVRVLQTLVSDLDLPITVSTIHSFLKLRVIPDYKTGKENLVRTKDTPLFNNVIIFIDEASYVDFNLKKIILSCFNNSKIVWIGDRDQLLSVGETSSCVLDIPDNPNKIHMVTPQRNIGTINALGHKFRNVLHGAEWPVIQETPEIEIISGQRFKQIVETEYLSDQYKKDPNYIKILGWTNRKVVAYNEHIRKLYTDTDAFVQGEYLTSNSAILGVDGIPRLSSDTTLKIQDASEVFTDGFFIDYQEITFYGVPEVFKVPVNFEQLQQVLKHEAKKAKQAGHWYEFFNLKNTYADFRPNHASTVHKSQGSTYSNVCIDLTDIGLNNKPMEVARLLYVGITRAKHKLYLYGELPDKYKGI